MRTYRAVAAAALVAALIAGIVPAAAAEQLDPRERPAESGPLRFEDKACRQDQTNHKGKSVATFRVCTFLYTFNPAQETNPDRDYGVLWMQASVDADEAWCTRSVNNDLELPGNGVQTKAPKPGLRLDINRKKRSYTTRLKVDANGNTSNPATVENSFIVRRGTLESKMKQESNTFRLRWEGNSNAKLAFAMGVEMAWDAGGQTPEIRPDVSAVLRNSGNC